MSINTPFPLVPIEQRKFAELDYTVMGHAFASQNELGRLCDECIYQGDLATRLETVSQKDGVKKILKHFSDSIFLTFGVLKGAPHSSYH